ncbi:MAG: beta-lactamase family protein [Alphaproteobacteria bacterium]|nr:beta-lactamase family protein [Alphaproteobacteria bacterium]
MPNLDKRLDFVFRDWDHDDRPGAAVAVLKGTKTIYSRGFGLASLEHGLPISVDTRFRIASITKQFTCALVLQLAEDGKLSLDDPLGKFLAPVAPFAANLSLRTLMHNASGLHDHLALVALAGGGFDRRLREPALNDLILRQRGVNFQADTAFGYSNANFLLLTRVVEKVAGQSFEALLRQRLLAPLGMDDTALVREPETVVPNLATPYVKTANGYRRALFALDVTGDGGMVSTVADLAKWMRAMVKPPPRLKATLEGLATRDSFRPSRVANRYAFGLEHGIFRGVGTISHGGLLPGWRAEFLRIPELDLGVIVTANVDALDPLVQARRVVEAMVKPQLAPIPVPKPHATPEPGHYWHEASGTLVLIERRDGAPRATMWGTPMRLQPVDATRWVAVRGVFPLTFSVAEGGLRIESSNGRGMVLERLKRLVKTGPHDLVGRYHAPELGGEWIVTHEGRTLELQIRGDFGASGPWPVTPITADAAEVTIVSPPWTATYVIRRRRYDTGWTSSLVLTGARVQNMVLKRIYGDDE